MNQHQTDQLFASIVSMALSTSSPICTNGSILTPWLRELDQRMFSLFGQCKHRIFEQLQFIIDHCAEIRIQGSRSFYSSSIPERFLTNQEEFVELLSMDEFVELMSIEEYYEKVKQRFVEIHSNLRDFWISDAFELCKGKEYANIITDARSIAKELLDIAFLIGADVSLAEKPFGDLDLEIRKLLKVSATLRSNETRDHLSKLGEILTPIDRAVFYLKAIIAYQDTMRSSKPKRCSSPKSKSVQVKKHNMKPTKTSNNGGWHSTKTKKICVSSF